MRPIFPGYFLTLPCASRCLVGGSVVLSARPFGRYSAFAPRWVRVASCGACATLLASRIDHFSGILLAKFVPIRRLRQNYVRKSTTA
jgi:hypothetical protein